MITYPDVILGGIPLVVGLAIGLGYVTPLSVVAGLTVGSLVAAGVMAHALFVRPPQEPAPTRGQRSAAVD